jgi:hypothetical protein
LAKVFAIFAKVFVGPRPIETGIPVHLKILSLIFKAPRLELVPLGLIKF